MVKMAAVLACVGLLAAGFGMSGQVQADDTCCAMTPTKEAGLVADPPVACSLTDDALRERSAEVRKLLSEAAGEARQVDHGYALDFASEHAAMLLEFIQFERACCPFFGFTLAFAPDNGPVTLSVTGPDAAQEMISGMFSAAS